MMTDLSRMGEAYHLLPESVKTCIGLIGLTKSVRLIHAWGGTTFPVGKNKRKGGQIRFAALAEVVGVEAAEILTRHYSGEVIAIPRCWRAMLALRNQKMRAEFDDITATETAIHAVSTLARRYEMTERRVWEILNQIDLPESRQETLF